MVKYTTDRIQMVKTGIPYGGGWTETEVRSSETWDHGKTASKVVVRTKHDACFVDIAIEEYTGESRRAKLCTARLDQDAARALYEQLKAMFPLQP